MKQLITLVYSIEYVPCLKHNVKHFTYICPRHPLQMTNFTESQTSSLLITIGSPGTMSFEVSNKWL